MACCSPRYAVEISWVWVYRGSGTWNGACGKIIMEYFPESTVETSYLNEIVKYDYDIKILQLLAFWGYQINYHSTILVE